MKKPTVKEREKARKTTGSWANRVAAMTPAERRKEIAKHYRLLDQYAPTLKSAKSDLLKLLQVVGAEFVRKYYPDATSASFHISKYTEHGRGPEYSTMLTMAVPNKG